MKEACTVYVSLLDEGVDVWRPVEAVRHSENVRSPSRRGDVAVSAGRRCREILPILVDCGHHGWIDARM